eukprot:TRINITY_DN2469_c0_g1_i2.p1 TRINITY_DN2469_c0_g1~~TRINITY_DN2469_c0_g1_i2.p1  ORF type:complete len:280 (-),score=22.80 TRINITY_DN2469_c0_g1_i2:127-966(-)
MTIVRRNPLLLAGGVPLLLLLAASVPQAMPEPDNSPFTRDEGALQQWEQYQDATFSLLRRRELASSSNGNTPSSNPSDVVAASSGKRQKKSTSKKTSKSPPKSSTAEGGSGSSGGKKSPPKTKSPPKSSSGAGSKPKSPPVPPKSPKKPKTPKKSPPLPPPSPSPKKSPKKPKKSPKKPKPPPPVVQPPAPAPSTDEVDCKVHKKEQLVIADGNLFFTGDADKCESQCVKDSSCLFYTFSGLSCQLFNANMTIKPTKACFSRKCQWAKCRDPPDDGLSF